MQKNNFFLPQAAGSDPVGNCKEQNNDCNILVKTIQNVCQVIILVSGKVASRNQ